MSKSQVSELAKELDGVVKSFRERPLSGAYRYLWLDALFVKCRENGRIVNMACLVAVGVNGGGRRRSSWQCCRTHFIRNLLTKVPKAAHGIVATFVRTIFAQPDAESVKARHVRTVEQLQPRFAAAAKMLEKREEAIETRALVKRSAA